MLQTKQRIAPPERKGGARTERFECDLIELKFSGADEKEMLFEGYGAVFGNVDSYGDVIAKGAFAQTIREAKKAKGQWPAMLLQHGAWQMSADDLTPIGVWVDMEEDDTGLHVQGKLAPTARGTEIYTLMKMQPRPAINGLSIGYIPVRWKMGTSPTEPRRTLEQIKLVEISPVTFPANPKARIAQPKGAHRARLAEQALRDVGFSQTEAKRILSQGLNSSTDALRDVGGLGDIAALVQRNTSIINP